MTTCTTTLEADRTLERTAPLVQALALRGTRGHDAQLWPLVRLLSTGHHHLDGERLWEEAHLLVREHELAPDTWHLVAEVAAGHPDAGPQRLLGLVGLVALQQVAAELSWASVDHPAAPRLVWRGVPEPLTVLGTEPL